MDIDKNSEEWGSTRVDKNVTEVIFECEIELSCGCKKKSFTSKHNRMKEKNRSKNIAHVILL